MVTVDGKCARCGAWGRLNRYGLCKTCRAAISTKTVDIKTKRRGT